MTTRTYTTTSTHTRLGLLEIQIRSVLRRTTDIEGEYLDTLMEGVSRRWLTAFHVYAFDREGMCRGELTLDIDWDEHGRQIAIGKQTVTIDARWRDDTAIEVDEAARFFELFVREFSLETDWRTTCAREIITDPNKRKQVYTHLGLTAADPVTWASDPAGRQLRISELPELKVGVYLSDD